MTARVTLTGAPTPVFGHRSSAVDASLREIDGRTVSWFSLDGGKHRGAIGTAEGDAIARAVHLAVELGLPVVGRIASSGADVNEGVSALHAWGRVAKALTDASGVVPVVLLLVGPAVSGPGAAARHRRPRDHDRRRVRLRERTRRRGRVHRRAHRPRRPRRRRHPRARERRGDPRRRRRGRGRWSRSSTCSPTCPSNHLEDPPARRPTIRSTARARVPRPRCPRAPPSSYDVRTVIDDVLDARLVLRAAAHVRAEHGHRPRSPRRSPRRHRRQPTDVPRRHARHRGVAEGGALRAVVRRVQLPADHVRRHARLRARARPRVARDDPSRRRARARVRGGDRPATVRRDAQGVRRRVHRDGLQEPRQRLVHRVAHRRDRGDGRTRRGADPLPARPRRHRGSRHPSPRSSSRSRPSTPTASPTRTWPPSAATSTMSSRPPTPVGSSPTRSVRLGTKRDHQPSRRHSNTPL